MNVMDRFRIDEQVVIITGGAGLLGKKHAETVLEAGGIPVLLDISAAALDIIEKDLQKLFKGKEILTYTADITKKKELEKVRDDILLKYNHIDVLINNAANNPKVEHPSKNIGNIQFHNFPVDIWEMDLAVGLTGSFLCAQIFGNVMASQGKGVILNVSSDLGIIAPDQRIYRKEGVADEKQIVKPITYSVIKHGLIGMTKYLATYWADKGIRSNAICPGGVYNGQNEEFLEKLTNLIPLGRMAKTDEYKGTVLFMISEASSYMTGSTLIVDGGRTCW